MTNCSSVPELFPTISGNSTDKSGQTVPPFPLFRGERGTVDQSAWKDHL
jgi:hypothetical protein